MTPEERIKFTLGDLIVRNALLESEKDELKAALAKQAEQAPPLAGDDLHA